MQKAAYSALICFQKELCGSVVVQGPSDTACRQGELIRLSIETAMEYAEYSKKNESSETRIASIAGMLLEDEPDMKKLLPLINKQEIDTALPRTIICVSLDFQQTGDANISLGYQAGNEQVRTELFNKLKANRYLNSQDIVYLYNENTIVIIKSFLSSSNTTRVFTALDIICRDLAKTMEEFNAFSFAIAYGDLSYGINGLKNSFNAAREIIRLGQQIKPNEHIFVLEHILFDKVCHHLYPYIVSKILEPIIAKLTRKKDAVPEELIDCAEAFVDNCLSLSETAKNCQTHRNTISFRLEKLKSLTGLDPANSFQDAFITKMLATYIRQHDL